jgi:hypothetical protein
VEARASSSLWDREVRLQQRPFVIGEICGYLLREMFRTVRDPRTLFQTVSLGAWVNRANLATIPGKDSIVQSMRVHTGSGA